MLLLFLLLLLLLPCVASLIVGGGFFSSLCSASSHYSRSWLLPQAANSDSTRLIPHTPLVSLCCSHARLLTQRRQRQRLRLRRRRRRRRQLRPCNREGTRRTCAALPRSSVVLRCFPPLPFFFFCINRCDAHCDVDCSCSRSSNKYRQATTATSLASFRFCAWLLSFPTVLWPLPYKLLFN